MKAEPWFVPESIGFLDSILTPESVIFEWGCGGSTLWLDKRVKSGWSVDHDWDWFMKLQGKLERISLVICKPWPAEPGDASDPDQYRSSAMNGDFKHYASFIDDKKLDVVLIDGRARASCIKHATVALKPGGWLIVDNTEREWYLEKSGKYLEGWERKTFSEPGWETSFWRKPLSIDVK